MLLVRGSRFYPAAAAGSGMETTSPWCVAHFAAACCHSLQVCGVSLHGLNRSQSPSPVPVMRRSVAPRHDYPSISVDPVRHLDLQDWGNGAYTTLRTVPTLLTRHWPSLGGIHISANLGLLESIFWVARFHGTRSTYSMAKRISSRPMKESVFETWSDMYITTRGNQ
jgi:hypothetical protein